MFQRTGAIRLLLAAAAAAILAPSAAAQLYSPTLVKDLDGQESDSFVEMLTPFNGRVYFRANDGIHGLELWSTDGTAAGTSMVLDINPSASNGFPDSITPVGSTLYFSAFDTDPVAGSQVWTSDGTAGGTQKLIDTWPTKPVEIFGPPGPSNFTPFGSDVVFTAPTQNEGNEIWKTDGTTGGTMMIKDIHPGVTDSFAVYLTPLAGKIYFAADDKFTPEIPGSPIGQFDRELFVTDGTEAGTFRLKDINPGTSPSIPVELTALDGQLLFRADDGTLGTELWTSDGTEAGTRLLKDINPTGDSNSQDYTIAGGHMFFSADDGVHGTELWMTDGTDAGTRLVKDINAADGSLPLGLTAVGHRVFFSADDGVNGIELWVSDGTDAGTYLVRNLNGPQRSAPLEIVALDDTVFFTAIVPDDANSTVRTQLWATDGTETGTQLVFEEPGSSYGYAITDLTVLGNQLLFVAPTGSDAAGLSVNRELFAITVPEPSTLRLGAVALAVVLAAPAILRKRNRPLAAGATAASG